MLHGLCPPAYWLTNRRMGATPCYGNTLPIWSKLNIIT